MTIDTAGMDDSDGTLRIEIFVADVERSAEFHERVLGFVRESAGPGYVGVRRGGARIGIGAAADLPVAHPLHGEAGERSGLGVEIVVEVEDVDDASRAAEARAGDALVVRLGERSWGLRDFRLVDPDGYYVRVTSR